MLESRLPFHGGYEVLKTPGRRDYAEEGSVLPSAILKPRTRAGAVINFILEAGLLSRYGRASGDLFNVRIEWNNGANLLAESAEQLSRRKIYPDATLDALEHADPSGIHQPKDPRGQPLRRDLKSTARALLV
jgi:hypothetical protein